MGKLQDAMRARMETRGYANRTIEAYLGQKRTFATYFGRSPLEISTEEIEAYFLYLRRQRRSDSTFRACHAALRCFYSLNGLDDRMPMLRVVRTARKVPRVLSQQKVSAMLQRCKSLKFRTLFALVYSSGLRLSELRNLTVDDLDFERRQVYIDNSKNQRSRYSVIGDRTIALLRTYLNVFRPHSYLFYKQSDRSSRISCEAIRRELKRLLADIGVRGEGVTLHTLRHCFATHLLENGVNIFYIKQLLGHASIKTTVVYLHMLDTSVLGIRSPIDRLSIAEMTDETGQRQLFAQSA